jgi:hypothetical protein
VIAFHRAAGSRLSAMEHIVPEEVFKDETNPQNSPQGISAVKALSIAAQQGQKIFTLTQANQNQLSFVTADAKTKQELAQALNQGKEVTIHEKPINALGWSGTGYLIIDPYNGTGAYKISGGTNGAFLALFFVSVTILFFAAYFGAFWLVAIGTASFTTVFLSVLGSYFFGTAIGELSRLYMEGCRPANVFAWTYAFILDQILSKILGPIEGLLTSIIGNAMQEVLGADFDYKCKG